MTAALIGPVSPPALHVMSFNIRRRMDRLAWRRQDRWSEREPSVRALMELERPTVLGVQEALPDQAATVAAALGPDYRYVGYGRNAGRRGEGCPLYYDTTRLELLDWEQTALSSRPDVAGSRSWGNPIPRVLVRARLHDRATSTTFLALNTHLDPFSFRSRVRAARSIRRMVSGEGLPAVVTGDLNAGGGSSTLRELLADGELTDAWQEAEERITSEWATFGNYRAPHEGSRIDWILTTPDVSVYRAAVNDRRYADRWPSDHLPVHAVVRLGEASRTA